MSAREITAEAISACCSAGSDRQKQIFSSLVKHLHGFISDVKPTDGEWMSAIQFLTDVGKMCDDKRQEFILLSDVMGVTALKDQLNNTKPEGVTETSVLGPFYRKGVEPLGLGASISKGKEDGERCLIKGRVTDIYGKPIKNAVIDVWQSASNGLYEQQDEKQPDMNLRGYFETNANGEYWFEAVKPHFYPIPVDGPVGQLLKKLERHEYRPGHIHFIVSADKYKPVTTQFFDKNSKYINSDAVFGVTCSLLVDFAKVETPYEYKGVKLMQGDWQAECNFVLDADDKAL